MAASSPRLPADLRAAIRDSGDSVRVLAARHGVNAKTIQRWRHRASAVDRPSGPRSPGSTALSPEDEAMVVSFRQITLLPLDDCLYALQPVIPHLRRSTLHRCLLRHGISALPAALRGGATAGVGEVYMFVTEAPTETGLCHLFGATDRRTRFSFAMLCATADARAAADFLGALRAAMPFRLDTALTDTDPCFAADAFRRACEAFGIGQVIAPLRHPAEARARRLKYRSPDELRRKLHAFIAEVNYGRRLKALGGITPHAAVCAAWHAEPWRFRYDPLAGEGRQGGKQAVLF